jgi:hypothetical protein
MYEILSVDSLPFTNLLTEFSMNHGATWHTLFEVHWSQSPIVSTMFRKDSAVLEFFTFQKICFCSEILIIDI